MRKEKKVAIEPADHRYDSALLYNEEVTQHLALIASRRESMNTRAGLLIASAAVSAGFATVDDPSGWLLAALVLTSVAAVVGIAALWPTASDVVSIVRTRETILPNGNAANVIQLADSKFRLVPQAAKRLKVRAMFVAIGFALLGLALLCAACHAFKVTITIGALHG